MSDKELRTRIAQLLGWKDIQDVDVTCDDLRGYSPYKHPSTDNHMARE